MRPIRARIAPLGMSRMATWDLAIKACHHSLLDLLRGRFLRFAALARRRSSGTDDALEAHMTTNARRPSGFELVEISSDQLTQPVGGAPQSGTIGETVEAEVQKYVGQHPAIAKM